MQPGKNASPRSEARLSAVVVGNGRAGRARLRALENHPGVELAGLVRREPGPGERSLEEVLLDPAVDVVILCTPNLLHEPAARASLLAEKHVLVEFPLAATASAGRSLLELAESRGKVLHVEHIELLSPSQKHQRARVQGLGRPSGGELLFTGGAEGWIADAGLAGSPALRAVARLHRLVDLFGEAKVVAAALDAASTDGYRLEVSLEFPGGGRTRLVEERGPGLARQTRWAIACEKGELDNPPAEPVGSLFRQDLDHFLARISEGRDPYVADARVLHVLELVEAIDSLVGGAATAT